MTGTPAPSLVFIDTETTGTNADVHELWELAALARRPDGSEETFHRFLRVTLDRASDQALAIGGFEDRYRAEEAVPVSHALAELCEFANEDVLLGLNVAFDCRFIYPALHRAGLNPTWHYSPVDVKSLAAGALGLAPPWRSEAIAAELGVRPADFARHAALGDCYYTAAMYDAAMALSRR